jgi:hypothetical protein
MLLEQSKQAVTLETRLVERGSSAIKIDA